MAREGTYMWPEHSHFVLLWFFGCVEVGNDPQDLLAIVTVFLFSLWEVSPFFNHR